MAVIEIQELVKQFDDGTTAVDRVSLTIEHGQLLVLVGPSGCGKSTLLRMIAGLESPSSGRILIDQRDVTDWPPGRRDMAMVFQNYALYPHMTVRENLAFGLRMRKTPRPDIQRRVQAVSDQLDLADLLERRPGQLSGGQRQRVALGRAIVREPLAFLLDEPLSNLDARLRGHTRMELADLHQRLQATMIHVTHDQTEAMTLGQQIAVMDKGKILQSGPPLELYQQPANRFVAGFLGNPPMNLVEGRIENGRFMAGGLDWPPGLPGTPENPRGNGPVSLGFRPEQVDPEGAGRILYRGRPRLIEQLGSDTLVHFELAGQPCVARLAGDPSLTAEDEVEFGVDPRAVFWFSADGQRLDGPGGSGERPG